MITNTPTMRTTLESILETMQITDHIKSAAASGEITQEQATALLDAVLDTERTTE